MDGAGAQRGRKDGPPDSYLKPLNPLGSPFFFGFQKPFFFQQGKRNGFCRPRKVRTVQNALSGISHSAPLLVLSPRDPLRWARAGTPFLHVVWCAGVVAPHEIKWCQGCVWEAAPHTKVVQPPKKPSPLRGEGQRVLKNLSHTGEGERKNHPGELVAGVVQILFTSRRRSRRPGSGPPEADPPGDRSGAGRRRACPGRRPVRTAPGPPGACCRRRG